MTKTQFITAENSYCCLDEKPVVQSGSVSFVPQCNADTPWTLDGGGCEQTTAVPDIRNSVDLSKLSDQSGWFPALDSLGDPKFKSQEISCMDACNVWVAIFIVVGGGGYIVYAEACCGYMASLTSLDIRGNVEILWFDGLVYMTIYKGQKKVSSIKVVFEDGTEIFMEHNDLYTQDKTLHKLPEPTLLNLDNNGSRNLAKTVQHEILFSNSELSTTSSRLGEVDMHSVVSASFLADGLSLSDPPIRREKKQHAKCENQKTDASSQQQSFEHRELLRCDMCPFAAAHEDLLEHHKAKKHKVCKPLVCRFCQRTYSAVRELNQHMKVHDSDKAYKCQYCPKGFNRYAYLKCHLRIHTGEKPFKCEDCAMCFTQKTHLIDHRRRAHTKERRFQCDVCGNCFFAATDLKQHIVVHTGLKRHKCNVCEKMFSQACNLKRHKLTHTGEKPFVCEICGKQFTRLQYLREHSTVHS